MAVKSNKCYGFIVKRLLQIPSIDVNKADIFDEAPLHTAAKHGYKDIAEALIAAGADIHKKSGRFFGKTPLNCAKTPELKAQMQKWFHAPSLVAKRAEQKKTVARHRWNFFISFLAGLTLVYPMVKIVQYFWKLRGIKKEKEENYAQTTQMTTVNNEQSDLRAPACKGYNSWSMYYEYGLKGKRGTSHTSKEIQQAMPENYRAALGIKLTA